MTDLIKATGEAGNSGKHGGARPNSGRKPVYDEPTTVMRVPASKKQLVQQFLQQVKNNPASGFVVSGAAGNAVITNNSSGASTTLSVHAANAPDGNIVPFPQPLHDLSAKFDLTPVKALTHYQIPVAQELIPAGFPSPAEDHIEDVLDLNEHLIRNKSATFVGRVGSASMLNAGFDVGDEILIDRSIEARHKDIVIAMIDNNFTMKRLMLCEYDDEQDCDSADKLDKPLSKALDEPQQPIWFKAENPDFDNIYPKDGQTVVIIGVVTFNIKRVFNR